MTEHVKIYGIKPRIQYVADGILTIYEFPFAIFKTSDINIYFGDELQDSSSYTVSEERHSDGGSITFESAPASGTIITIVRNLSVERTSDFQEGSTLRAKVLNDELDYQIACQQQIADNLNRSMVLPPYAADSDVNLTLPTPSAGKAIIWNADGSNLENSTVQINALESTLKAYKDSAESASLTATSAAATASIDATNATTQAGLATAAATTATAIVANKANLDMDNLSNTGKRNVITLMMPDYTSGSRKLIDVEYTAETNGWLFIYAVCNNKITTLTVNGVEMNINYSYKTTLDVDGGSSILLPLSVGDTYKVSNASQSTIMYFPMKTT